MPSVCYNDAVSDHYFDCVKSNNGSWGHKTALLQLFDLPRLWRMGASLAMSHIQMWAAKRKQGLNVVTHFPMKFTQRIFPWLSDSLANIWENSIYEWRIGKHCVWQRVVKLETVCVQLKGLLCLSILVFLSFCCRVSSALSQQRPDCVRRWTVNYRLTSVSLTNKWRGTFSK